MQIQMLDKKLNNYIETLIERYPILNSVEEDIIEAYCILEDCFLNGNKLLIAGNGGSAADSEHIVGELMKGFKKKRAIDKEFTEALINVDYDMGIKIASSLQKGLPAISICNHYALNTAFLNDVDGELCFAQQVNGYGNKGDVLLAISTSGNSRNILYSAVVAKAKEMKVIGLTGENGGELSNIANVTVKVPEKETFMVQELQLPVYHCWCLMLEEMFFV